MLAYQQIPRAARGRKHVQAAEWIEREAGTRVADHAEFLVHHYSQAVDLGRAAGEDVGELEERLVRFSVLAGDRAMRLDVAAAEAAYRRAVDVVGDPDARSERPREARRRGAASKGDWSMPSRSTRRPFPSSKLGETTGSPLTRSSAWPGLSGGTGRPRGPES